MTIKMSKHKMPGGWAGLSCGLVLLLWQTAGAQSATYSASPTNGRAPLTVQFTGPTDDSALNLITSWQWDFGDGSPAVTNQSPSHTYTNAGVFTPSLEVTNSPGLLIAASGPSIAVSPRPPAGVGITAPANGASFTTNQSFTFSASAHSTNGIQSLALYTNSVLITSIASNNISTILSNLPSGSYQLTAVATQRNRLVIISAVVHVTINVPGTTLIDFEALDASRGPVRGTTLSNYLAGYGVTVSNVTEDTTLAVQDDQNIFNGTVTAAYSGNNLLTQSGSNGSISYTLVFNQSCTSVSWERTELLADSGGVVAPAWTAYAYDGNSNALSQVGEDQVFSLTNMPAKSFTLYGSNIAFINFAADNNINYLDSLPLDNLLLSTNAPTNPQPTITLTAGSFTSTAPGQISLTANAFESGGTISRIEFYENQNLTGSPATTPSGTNTTASISLADLAAGTYTFHAVATDANGAARSSTNVIETVTALAGVEVINFDDPVILPTSLGAVGGTALSNYLLGFGITITNATLGTRLEAINQNSFSGNELPVPSSPPNLFTQMGSSQPVTFTLNFATNQENVSFTRVGINTNGPSGISHPAWTARIFDGSGNELGSASEPLLFSSSNIPPRTFTLASSGMANIASLRFDSDSQQTAGFAAVLLDDLVLETSGAGNPLSISVTSPLNGATNFTAPASIPLEASVGPGFGTNYYVAFYSGPTLIGASSPSGSTFTWSNVLNGTYILTARVLDASGYSLLSAPVTITVQPGGNATVVNFDSLDASNAPVTGATLAAYLAANGMIVASNSPGTTVEVEDQTNVAGGGFVTASSSPNLLTQTGSNGPMIFTVGFSNWLTQFAFTRPELLANPFVTHPAWQVDILDPLGNVLAAAEEPLISSYTNVPAQTYTFKGQGIASVDIVSTGSGLTIFPAMLLDDFVLTTGTSVLITNPTSGQIITASLQIPVSAATADVSGTVTNVTFYHGGTNLAGSAQSSPFSIVWSAPSNGFYVLTAVAVNNSGLSSTSAPVSITVATGFAFETKLKNQTIAVGRNATFSVTTTETNATYQWQTNGAAIPGATNSSYTISNAALSAAGSYTVVASSAGLSITSQPPAVLTVLTPPGATTVVQTPSSIDIGDTVTLTENATPDDRTFTYQWRLNGTRIAGATNRSYTISNAQPFNSGDYRVNVGETVAYQETPAFNVTVNFAGNTPTTTNDNFASSIPIDPLVGPVAGINSNSPAAGELAKIAGKSAGKFLWYNWRADFTGVMSLTTLGSSFDTLLGVYTGTNVADLKAVAQDDDSGGFFTSLVRFNCQQGTTYQIAVAGFKGAAGNVILGLPSGTGYRVLDPDSGDAVPVITRQPSHQIVQAGADLTLSVTANNATTYQWFFANAPVFGANANTLVISNFPASAVGNYYVLAANEVGAVQSDTAIVQIAAEKQNGAAGTPTTLAVDKFGDAVDLTSTVSPSRYRPADAGGDTGGFTLSQSFSTVGATREAGEPDIAGQLGGASYWYSYTAPAGGTLQFDTAGSSFNTMLAVYTGPGSSFSSLVNVGAAYTTNYVVQGQPVVLVSNVTSGTTFYISVDGYLGASGAAHLDVVLNPATNLTVNTNIPPITNNYAIVAVTHPANNYLTTNSAITVSGTLRGGGGKALGQTTVQMTVNTNAPVNATLGAAGATVAWTLTNVTLVTGPNVITAQSFSLQSDGTTNVSVPVTRTVFFAPAPPLRSATSTLTLSTIGRGKITGLASNATLEVNKIYKVTAVPTGNWVFTNWTSGTNTNSLTPLQPNEAALSFLMSSNLILQATFVTNPFTPFAGVYNGLFAPAGGATEESSGFFTARIPASSHGAYSARLLLDGYSHSFSGTFDLSGDAGTTLARSGNTFLIVELHLNLAAPDDQITGTVIDGANPGWISQLQADRAVFNAKSNPATNYNGRYTLILPPGANAPTNDPGGYGYVTLTNNPAGQVSLIGQLGDGTAISQSVPVSEDGYIPLYVSLYSRQGSLLGWLALTNNASNSPAQTVLGSNLSWFKISSRTGTLYSGGFTNTNITTLGSLYVPPQAGANIIALTNGTLTISNGNLGALVYSNLTIEGNKLVNNDPNSNPTNKLEGIIAPGTGILTVTFRATDAHANTVAKGVVLQDGSQTNAAGWFLGTGQSGFFLLQQ